MSKIENTLSVEHVIASKRCENGEFCRWVVAVKLFTANNTSVLFYFRLYLCTFVSCLH